MTKKKGIPSNTSEKRAEVVRDERGRWVKGTPAPNPKGAPKRGQSWQETIRHLTDMDRDELVAYVGGEKTTLGKTLREIPAGIPIKDVMILIALVQFGREPDARMLSVLMDREEGKPKQVVDLAGSVSIDGLQKQLDKAYGSDSNAE